MTGTRENDENRGKHRQKVEFQVGDRVLVKNMSLLDFLIKQEDQESPVACMVRNNMNNPVVNHLYLLPLYMLSNIMCSNDINVDISTT